MDADVIQQNSNLGKGGLEMGELNDKYTLVHLDSAFHRISK